MTKARSLDPNILSEFTGSENWYPHGLLKKILFTDGAKYVVDHGGAYWLIDEIAFAQHSTAAVAAEEFQVWKLKVNADESATLTCEDGNYNTVFTKEIGYTDFLLPDIILWFSNNTIYLPSEH